MRIVKDPVGQMEDFALGLTSPLGQEQTGERTERVRDTDGRVFLSSGRGWLTLDWDLGDENKQI